MDTYRVCALQMGVCESPKGTIAKTPQGEDDRQDYYEEHGRFPEPCPVRALIELELYGKLVVPAKDAAERPELPPMLDLEVQVRMHTDCALDELNFGNATLSLNMDGGFSLKDLQVGRRRCSLTQSA